VNLLSYEGTSVPAISSAATTIPAPCQTAGYLAGANEIAIVSTDITYQSAGTSSVFMSQWYNTGSGYTFLGTYAVGPLAMNAWGTLHNQAQLPLTPGTTYRFVTGISAGSATSVTLSSFTCRGLVMIVRKQQP